MQTHKSHILITLGILLVLVLTLSFRTSFISKIAEAVAPNPSWWKDNNGNFSQYDTYQFKNGRTHQGTFYSGYGTDSNIISTNSSYDGVAAIGPTGTVGGSIDTFFTEDANATDELEWQCTELVKRYMYLEYGTRSIPANGDEVVDNYTDPTLGYTSVYRKVSNDGTTQTYPLAGDVLSYSTVHTALVKSVTGQSSGSATVQLLEQNASSTGLTYQDFNNWKFRNGVDNQGATDTVTGWLTPRTWSVQTSPNLGSQNWLRAVTSTSSTDVWTVGYSASGSAYIPTAYHWDGSTWGSNAISGYSSNTRILYGVSEISSTDMITVGYYQPAGGGNTSAFAMHGNGTSWSSIPVDSPGTYPALYAVDADSSGNAWAVGETYSGNTYRPLIEQYQGPTTGFTKYNDPFPNLAGTTNNILRGVTVLSSTNAWAVGEYRNGSNQKRPLIYHWDGTSWASSSASMPLGATTAWLNGVHAISASDVWAVGGYSGSKTYIIHWDGSSWSVVSSPSPSPTGDDQLYAVSAISNGEVYAVGMTRGPVSQQVYNPLVLRFNGQEWKQMTAPSGGNPTNNYIYGVTVTSSGPDAGKAWMVGHKAYSSPSTTLIEQLY